MPFDPLAVLRDIHLPPEWLLAWPPAPGWWLLAALLIVAALLLARRARHPQGRRLRRQVRAELARIERNFAQHANARRLLDELAALLRRAALARDGRTVASLAGHRWADYLAAHAAPGADPLIWHAVAQARYAAADGLPPAAQLLAECRRWLEAPG